MKKISLLFSVVLFIMLGSCAKNDKVEIIESQDNLQMAEFRNMEEFNNTVEDLLQSSEEIQIAWCKERGLISQNMMYDQALTELDRIGEQRDTLTYYHELSSFKMKYSAYFLFNEHKEDNDISPYIPSNTYGRYLVCNANGDVKIAGKIKNFNELKSFDETTYGKYLRGFSRSKKDTIEEKVNSLYIREGGDRKMSAEAFRSLRGVYIKYEARKKNWLGSWRSYKTTYLTQYISHAPYTWTEIGRDFQMYMDNRNIMVESNEVKSGTTVFLGNTLYDISSGKVIQNGIAKFKCTSRGTYGKFGILSVNI